MKRQTISLRGWVEAVCLPGLSSLLLVLPLAFAIVGCAKEQKVQPQPPAVEVAPVAQKDVPVLSEWVGTTDGFVNATIRAQVQGYLVKQNYRDGDLVKKGQVLFEIDPREFQAALDQSKAVLDQSKGALDQSKAALEQAKATVNREDARWTTAKANLARVKPLAEQNAVSLKDLDDAVGMELSTRSSVESAKAGVAAAQANIAAANALVLSSQAAIEKAQLNVGFTKITSPVEGVAGIAKAQIGNLVGPGSVEELTTVSTIDPIKCYVSISEMEAMKAQAKKADRSKIPLDLILSDGSIYPHKGEVAFADRQIDVRTGTIRVATTFPNPQGVLRPGMFSRVRAEMGMKKGAMVVPQRAITEVQGRYLLATVGPDNKVAIRQVKVGERVGQLWVVSEGVKPGEKVVAEGIQKVKDGMVVSPKPFVGEAPAASGGPEKAEVKAEAKPQLKPEKR